MPATHNSLWQAYKTWSSVAEMFKRQERFTVDQWMMVIISECALALIKIKV